MRDNRDKLEILPQQQQRSRIQHNMCHIHTYNFYIYIHIPHTTTTTTTTQPHFNNRYTFTYTHLYIYIFTFLTYRYICTYLRNKVIYVCVCVFLYSVCVVCVCEWYISIFLLVTYFLCRNDNRIWGLRAAQCADPERGFPRNWSTASPKVERTITTTQHITDQLLTGYIHIHFYIYTFTHIRIISCSLNVWYVWRYDSVRYLIFVWCVEIRYGIWCVIVCMDIHMCDSGLMCVCDMSDMCATCKMCMMGDGWVVVCDSECSSGCVCVCVVLCVIVYVVVF